MGLAASAVYALPVDLGSPCRASAVTVTHLDLVLARRAAAVTASHLDLILARRAAAVSMFQAVLTAPPVAGEQGAGIVVTGESVTVVGGVTIVTGEFT